MKRLALTAFSLRYPWLVLVIVLAVTAVFTIQFPKVRFDNDPENMLAEDEAVRVFHHQVKEKYALYDFVIAGVVNETHPDGIFNVDTLRRIDTLTRQLMALRRSADGLPQVPSDTSPGEWETLDLTPESAFHRVLAKAFRHDPNNLFDDEGRSAVIGRELISPSVVDNIKQSGLGSLKLEYLMEHVPATREDAMVIRDDAMGNPLYNGTLVAEDGRAICLYIPIQAKTYSYNVATLVRELTAGWEGDDAVHITGLPVAEDTFGVEMLIQMATSAPLAGLAIFILLLIFFKRVALIIAPMLVGVFSILCTMGLLIGLGFDVHIMSSMIAIFLMPIAVADAVHILSEFFDVYHRFNDKKETIRHVIGHLFRPMLYTTLTTVAGFASLATTPIPPVRVFGLHVAFGVALAWLLTMTFVPAYITLFISKKSLHKLCAKPGQPEACEVRRSPLDRFLTGLGGLTYRRARVILGVAVAVLAFSIYGVSRIQVNDNPVKWFTKNHEIRVADRVLNDHFGGTYTAYLTLAADPQSLLTCREEAMRIRNVAIARFSPVMPDATREFLTEMDQVAQRLCNVETCDPNKCLAQLLKAAERIDEEYGGSWELMADEINYMDPDGLTHARLTAGLEAMTDVSSADRAALLARLEPLAAVSGDELLDGALEVCDRFTALSFRDFILEMKTELTAPAFKRPDVLGYIEDLQEHLLTVGKVGKTSSAVDALKKAAYELRYVEAPSDADADECAEYDTRNAANFGVPESAAAAGQVFIQLEGMKKKDSLFHLVTRDYMQANIWVQLTSGDNRDMQVVIDAVDAYMAEHEPPVKLDAGWAGLTYLNVVWQDKMVKGMFMSLASSFVVVLVMMIVLFRSPLYGVLSMIPLSVTILFIYGLIGWVGKDYDMPVAVLSALTLGLSVDFAIHFLERAREEHKRFGNWKDTCGPMFREPAMAISRNAITISIGFTPLLVAPLVPYRTVGFFLATIMAISWLATLFLLPALVTVLERVLFRRMREEEEGLGGEIGRWD